MFTRSILLMTIAVFASCGKRQNAMIVSDNTDLQIGTPVDSTLKKHDTHTFRVNLNGNAFVHGYADQHTVDVVVEIFGPDNKKIASFDSPARGPEPYQFKAVTSGIYSIVVTPFQENEGYYTLFLRNAEPVAAKPEERIRQLIIASGIDNSSPGVSLAVMKDDKIVYSDGFGNANLEYGIRNTPQTIFHVASVSKQFTAFAIAMLADQGKLSLQDDIRKYLPELYDFGQVITIDHLVHHTSGLRDQWNLLALAGWRLDDVITQKQIMRLISKQRELNFRPGEEMVYCNTGFTLMAEIVQRVTGESFGDWMRKNVFDPLEMKSTFFYEDHEKIVNNRAYSYYRGREGFKKSVLSYANAGATSLFTTAEDLSRWAMNFEKMTVGSEEVMDMMNQRFRLNNGDTTTYAFGQDIGKHKGLKTVSHGGADAGYRSFFLRFPDQHFSVAVLSNLGSFNPGQLSYEIADVYLAEELREEVETKAEAQRTSSAAPQGTEEVFDPASVSLGDYTGAFYSPELESSYTFVVRKDTLTALHQRHDDIKFRPVSKDKFACDAWFMGSIEFMRDGGGKIAGMRATSGRVRNVKFEKQ